VSGAARKLVVTIPDAGVPALPAGSFEKHAKWPVLQTVEVPLAVRVPLVRLTLRDVRGLQPGAVLMSEWPAAEEVPLYAADVVLSWCEFAVVDGIMAARLTRLG
jgi:flagellar motor switch protein FliM